MDDLLKRMRNYNDSLAPPMAKGIIRDAKRALEAANARIADLEQELRNIANADTVAWDDPTEFEAWAKSRARHTLGKTDKEKP